MMLWMGLLSSSFLRGGEIRDITFTKLDSLSRDIHWPIYNTCQDWEGVMWFSGENKLTRFDGRQIEHLHLLYGDSKLGIIKVFHTGEDRLLIATDKGIFSCRGVSVTEELPEPLFDYSVNDMIRGHDDTFWIGTNQGLFKFSASKGILEHYSLSEGLPSEVVHGFFFDKDSTLWISTWEGLVTLAKDADSLDAVHHRTGHRLYGQIAQDGEGHIWAGGPGEIAVFNDDLELVDTISSDPSSGSIPPAYIPWNILLADENGRIWHAVHNALQVYDPVSGNSKEVKLDLDFRIERLTSLFNDRDGSIWLTTTLGNIYRCDFNPFSQEEIPSPGLKEYLKSVQIINAVYHKYFVLASAEGVVISSDDFRTILHLTASEVQAVHIDMQDRIWIAEEDQLRMFALDSLSLEISETRSWKLPDGLVTGILVDGPYCWISTLDRGVYCLQYHENTTETYKHHPGDIACLTSNHISSMALYRDKIWLGTIGGGIITIDRNSRAIREFVPDSGSVYSELKNVKALIPNGNKIWITSNMGVASYDGMDYRRVKGLENMEALQVLVDPGEFLWISHKMGMDVYDTRNELQYSLVKNFSPDSDLFLFTDHNHTVLSVRDAGIWKHTSHMQAKGDVNTIISQLRVNDSVYQHTSDMQLNFRDNSIQIDLAVMSYRFSDRNKYAVFLDGVDKNWRSSDSPVFQYQNLKPGEYRLRYKGANFAGTWSPEKILTFSVNNPPWLNPWSIVGYLLGFLLLATTLLWLQKKNQQLALTLNSTEADLQTRTAQWQGELFNLLRTTRKDEGNLPSEDSILLQDFVRSVNRHLGNDDLSVELIASDLSISRTKLFRHIKRITELSPSEFINTYRLRLAEDMLRNKSGNISQIAFRVGFKNPAHFSENFRKSYGCSPSEFQKSIHATKRKAFET